MPEFDLRPACERLAALLQGVPDDALGRLTPCEDLTLGQLLGHVIGFAEVFALSARKDLGPTTATPPSPDAADLEPGWQARAAEHLEALGEAWQADEAWEGMTQAGGVDLPGAMAGRIALDDLVVHGWDVARATGQPFEADDADLRSIEEVVLNLRERGDGRDPRPLRPGRGCLGRRAAPGPRPRAHGPGSLMESVT